MSLRIDRVTPQDWRARCEALLAAGGRFLALYAVDAGQVATERLPGGPGVRALFAGADGPHLLAAETPEHEVPSVVDLVPAAGWDEREAHDLYGLAFGGHVPLRSLVEHTADLASWTLEDPAHDVHQVAVGPIHAGVIESGHFRFHVTGENVLHVDLRLFYKHRGLERAAEGRPFAEGLRYMQRACAACAVSNAMAYINAAESLLGLWPETQLSRARTILLELERLYNHLNDIGAACAGVGFAAGSMAFAALKERALRLNRSLTGHRFLFDTVALAKSDWSVSAEVAADARAELESIGAGASKAWQEVYHNASVRDRWATTGAVSPEEALRLGAVGPAARAVGIPLDARLGSPRLLYKGFQPVTDGAATGDVAARLNVRAMELPVTLELLGGLLDEGLRPSGTEPGESEPVGVGHVESPRGETVCVLEAREDTIARVHLRTSSFANWPAVALAAADNILSDFPIINKSFELCYSCCDR